MAWIESHQSLGAHPKTKKLARLLNVPIPQVVGHLHMLWWWAFDYAQDGDLSRYAAEDIADAVLWEGSASLLLASLLDAGFLDQPNGNPRIHDWDEYGGKLLAKRRSDAERKAKAARTAESQGSSDGVPTEFRRQSQVEDIEESRGEEKRVEEKRVEDAPAGAAKEPPAKRITDSFRQEMRKTFPDIDEEEEFDRATNHTAYRKAIDKQRYYRNWLRRATEFAAERAVQRPPVPASQWVEPPGGTLPGEVVLEMIRNRKPVEIPDELEELKAHNPEQYERELAHRERSRAKMEAYMAAKAKKEAQGHGLDGQAS